MITPRVSVIIPTYNRAATLGRAIESALAQTYVDREVIVVDDGSTDETAAIVARYGEAVRYVRQMNRGVAAARNRGVAAARGPYVAFLDSDDAWLPDKLERQVAWLDAQPELGFVYAQAVVRDEAQRPRGLKPAQRHPDTLEELLRGNFIPTLTVVARRDAIQAVGGFDEMLSGTEDYDLWLRLAVRYPFTGMRETLGIYHHSGHGLSADTIQMYGEYLKVFAKLARDEAFAPQQALVRRRLAVIQYQFAKGVYQRRMFSQARRHFLCAVRVMPAVGVALARPSDSWVTKTVTGFKPYLAIAASSLRSWLGRPAPENERPVRVLAIEIGSGFGGSALQLARVCRHLDRRRFEPVIVAHAAGGHIERLKQRGLRVYQVPRPDPPRHRGLARIRGYGFLVTVLPLAFRLARLCRRERIGLIYLNNGLVAELAGVLAGRLCGIPVVSHLCGYDRIDGVSRVLSRWVDQFVCTASGIQDIHERELGLRNGRIRVIHDGFELNDSARTLSRAEARRSVGLREDACVVALVGRMVPGKGYEELVEAARLLAGRIQTLQVLLVGDTPPGVQGSLRAVLERRVETAGLSETVRFLGWRQDAPTILVASDVIAVPSTCQEGGPMVILEAMAMEKPVVASRIGGIPDMVQDGHTGLLVPPGDSLALAEAIEHLLGDGELARRMGAAGRARLQTVFSSEREIQELQEVYEHVLGQDAHRGDRRSAGDESVRECATNVASGGIA